MGSNNVETVTVDGLEYVFSEKSGPNVPVRKQDVCRWPGCQPNKPSFTVSAFDWNRGRYDVFIPKELINFEGRTYVKVGESRKGNRPSPGCVIRFRPNGYVRRYDPTGVDISFGVSANMYWPSGKYDILRRHVLYHSVSHCEAVKGDPDATIPYVTTPKAETFTCGADMANQDKQNALAAEKTAAEKSVEKKPKAFLTFNLGFADAFLLLSMASEGLFHRWSPAATKDLQDSYDNDIKKIAGGYVGDTVIEFSKEGATSLLLEVIFGHLAGTSIARIVNKAAEVTLAEGM